MIIQFIGIIGIWILLLEVYKWNFLAMFISLLAVLIIAFRLSQKIASKEVFVQIDDEGIKIDNTSYAWKVIKEYNISPNLSMSAIVLRFKDDSVKTLTFSILGKNKEEFNAIINSIQTDANKGDAVYTDVQPLPRKQHTFIKYFFWVILVLTIAIDLYLLIAYSAGIELPNKLLSKIIYLHIPLSALAVYRK